MHAETTEPRSNCQCTPCADAPSFHNCTDVVTAATRACKITGEAHINSLSQSQASATKPAFKHETTSRSLSSTRGTGGGGQTKVNVTEDRALRDVGSRLHKSPMTCTAEAVRSPHADIKLMSLNTTVSPWQTPWSARVWASSASSNCLPLNTRHCWLSGMPILASMSALTANTESHSLAATPCTPPANDIVTSSSLVPAGAKGRLWAVTQ